MEEPELLSTTWGVRGETLIFQDDIAYLAAQKRGIMAMGVENPENPAYLNEPLAEYETTTMVIREDMAYVWDQVYEDLRILDISDLAEPEFVGVGDWGEIDFHRNEIMTFYGDYLYIISRDGTFVIDISDPTEPTFVNEAREPIGERRHHVVVRDGYLYITGNFGLREDNGVYGLSVYDLSDPFEPELIYSTNDFYYQRGGASKSWYDGDLLYQLSIDREDMIVYSLTNPAEPELIGHWFPEGEGRPGNQPDIADNFFIENSIAYCNERGTLVMYSVEEPTEPDTIDIIDFPYIIWDIALEGEIAYMQDNEVGVVCLSIEDPYNPEVVGYYDTPGNVHQVIPHNGHIFVADNMELGIYRLDYEVGDNADFLITLAEGWNLISSPFAPEEPDMESIFSRLAVRSDIVIAKDYEGHFYLPGRFNNLPDWDVNQGYQIKLNRANGLWITGEEVAADRAIPLPAGWTMVSYFPNEEIETETAFANIVEQLVRVKDDHGNFYAPEHGFNNIPPLHRGEGYQLKTTEEIELVWNVEEDERQAGHPLSLPQPTHFVAFQRTSGNMSVLIKNVKITGEVGVFTDKGLCLGASVVTGGDVGLAVWGDDPTTEEIDGAIAGEELTFKIWDGDSEYFARFEEIEGEITWELDGLLRGRLIVSERLPVEFGIQSAYPNPFNSSVQLSYGLSEAGVVSLIVYDLSGREVIRLIDGEGSTGTHIISWDASNIATGVYFAGLEQGAQMAMTKLLLVK